MGDRARRDSEQPLDRERVPLTAASLFAPVNALPGTDAVPYGERMDDRQAQQNDEDSSGYDAPAGGDETTAEQLVADNPAEEDTLKALDPEAPSA